jgi:hypothetical protein
MNVIAAVFAADSAGVIHGNLTLADIFFLVAAIVFFVACFVYTQLTPKPIAHILVSGALGVLALGLLVQ